MLFLQVLGSNSTALLKGQLVKIYSSTHVGVIGSREVKKVFFCAVTVKPS